MSNQLIVRIPASTMARITAVDMTGLVGLGCDEVLKGIVLATTHFMDHGYWTANGASSCLKFIRSDFIPWLSSYARSKSQELSFSDIDSSLLQAYVDHLKAKDKYTTAAVKYGAAIRALKACEEIGLVGSIASVRPANPFADVGSFSEHAKPYSKRERSLIVAALSDDLRSIRAGSFVGIELEKVAIYFLSMQLRTGFNSGPLVGLGRDALIEHPLRAGYKLLVAYKERAKKEIAVPVQWHKSVDDLVVCTDEVSSLYREILELTREWWQRSDIGDRAFIRPPLRTKNGSQNPVPLTLGDVTGTIRRLTFARHQLIDDAGSILVPSGRRLRATLAERVFQLSGGDPLVVSRVLNNRLSVTNRSYLEYGRDTVLDFSTSIEEFVVKLGRGSESNVKTPLGACTDPLSGRFAPKDGVTYCERWLQCFKCPNQCITGEREDLWRLYSFYWLLQRKSNLLRRTQFSGLFRFVVRVLDGPLMEKFGSSAGLAKERARSDPHPFWALTSADGLFDAV